MASQGKTNGASSISRLLNIIQEGKYAADADRLINIVDLLNKKSSLREREELDRDLHMWRHQAELRDFWVPDVKHIHWRSSMFGCLLHLRRLRQLSRLFQRGDCAG